ncbi:MAG: hypothetical protein RIS88_722 [Pseudomonadota bacterium]
MSASPPPEVQARIARLFIYPVKSCAGVELREAELTDAGLDLDRAWMVVDAEGEFVSQRELPRMALVQVQLKWNEVILRAPGMLSLHLHVDRVEAPAKVRVWDDVVPAYDMGDTAAQWFSDFLGQRLRLVRFDPEHRRLSSLQATGGVEAPNQFSDGFPLLVVGEASLEALNARLAAGGHAPAGMERFRPNIVLAGLQAHDEDRLGVLHVQADAPVQLVPVKPCIRCSIPDIDPATAQVGTGVGDTLQAYRGNAKLGGAVTFGMNVIVRDGDGVMLRVGQELTADWAF